MYKEIEVHSLSDILRLSNILEDFDFRGQATVTQPLLSSLEREMRNMRDMPVTEEAIIVDFQVKSQNYIADRPHPKDLFNWFALLQHHGGYTRLLDFTRSIYISLFFALENAKDSDRPVIWAIHGNRNNESLIQKIQEHFGNQYNSEVSRYALKNDILSDIISGKSTIDFPCVYKYQTFEQFSRVGVQQGVFYCVLNSTGKFHQQLFASNGIEYTPQFHTIGSIESYTPKLDETLPTANIIRITFQEFIDKTHWLKELWKMNISSESLFPGLDGYARSTRHTIRINR